MSSKFTSHITTPLKQSLLNQPQNISPKKNGQNIFTYKNSLNSSYNAKSTPKQSAESSLIIKMIEQQITTEQQYQNLLIHNKEMEIKLLELQEQALRLRKDFKRVNKPIEQAKVKIQNGRLSLIEKQKYLEKFYQHLDAKLKPNMHSNLFGRLEKIQTALERKYQNQKQELYQSLAAQHDKILTANEQLQKLRQYRDQLIKSYTQRAIEISSQRNFSQHQSPSAKESSEKISHKRSSNAKSQKSKSSEVNLKLSLKQRQKQKQRQKIIDKKQQKKREKLQNKKQCQYLKEAIQKLKKQKEIVQKDQKILKLLLNIDEQHKKYSAFILNGFKKIFTIKYRGILSKKKRNSISKNQLKASSAASLPNVQGLAKQLNLKVSERKVLQREVQQRNIALEECKTKLNQQIGQYSELQHQIMKISNKNMSPNKKSTKQNEPQIYNARSTYTGNLSVENNRSTYTSYKKHSGEYEEDL